jgi:transcriptional regulator with PAS, ATPase and Fis domain
MLEPSSTQELVLDGAPEEAGQADLLVHIGQSHRLLDPSPEVIDLSAMDRLDLGRGEAQRLRILGTRCGRFEVLDPSMSATHATLALQRTAEGSSVLLQDHHSTNGCRVNGELVDSARLVPGDIVETGQTFWIFHRYSSQRLPLLLRRAYRSGPVLPTSSVSLALLDQLTRLMEFAATDIPLIILGESGTGKEVMTLEVHRLSGRPGRFVPLNCTALPAGLIESEMFGHRRGAFTGATVDKRGFVEVAEGGTLLLDEVGDMPLQAQAKLLRLLQDGTFVRVGETMGRRVDVRFIAATHRNLGQMVEQGSFRGDLYARLNGFSVRLPALRERREDIGLLLSVLLERSWSVDATPRMDPRTYRLLLQYDWPYNIRELEHTVRSAAALAGAGGLINLGCMPDALRKAAVALQDAATPASDGPRGGADATPTAATAATPAGETAGRRRAGRRRLTDEELSVELPRLLSRHQGNLAAVAQELSTSRSQVHRWLKRTGIDPNAYRK